MKQKVICIIPARGGSKSIKLKNLSLIGGKPLIYFPIISAIKSGVCDEIFVSTDNKKIAREAKKYGAKVPFLREKEYSGDFVTTEDTLKNALISYEKFVGHKFDICVFLTCTNIFRDHNDITLAVNKLREKIKIDSAFTVKKLYRHFWTIKNKKLTKVLPWMKRYHSRQNAPKLFREETSVVCATRARFWRNGKRIGKNVHLIENKFPFSEIDINDKYDLQMANFALKILKKNKYLSKKII